MQPVDLSDVCTLEGEQPGVTRLGPVPGLPPAATAFSFAAHPGAANAALCPYQPLGCSMHAK